MTLERNKDAEEQHRNTQTARIRAVLSDMQWHWGAELTLPTENKPSVWRFGGALERIRKGKDKWPIWEIISEQVTEDGAQWRYRWTGKILTAPQLMKLSPKERILQLEAEVVSLRAQLAKLRQLIGARDAQLSLSLRPWEEARR